MRSRVKSLLKSIREEFNGETYSLIELNSGRIGLPYSTGYNKELPLSMVIASDDSSVTYAERTQDGIIVTTISLNQENCCSYIFKPSEIDLLYQFNISSTSELNKIKAESQYPAELQGMNNIGEFGDSLYKSCNVNVHSPALTLTPAKNAWDSALRKPGSIVIAIGKYQFGIDEETRGAIFRVVDGNKLETVYNPDLGSAVNNISFESSLWNDMFDSGVKFYVIDPETLKKLETPVTPDSLDSNCESFIDPVKYRASLSRIHGDKTIKNQIMEAIDFAQEFNTVCEKNKLDYYEDYKRNNSSRNFRNMISNLTKLDFDINESISRYESYTRKVNEGRDEFIISMERKGLDSCVKDLFNLVSDLKSEIKTY